MIDTQVIQKIANLAKLSIKEDQLSKVTSDLESVIKLINAIQEIDTTGVEPMIHPFDGHQHLRLDSVTETNQRDYYQEIAPLVENGLYLVPKVID